MKRYILLVILLVSITTIFAQKKSIDGQYKFIYNDSKRIVDLISSSNTFIEYDENFNHLTDGSFLWNNGSYHLTPIMKTNTSQISIPVNFKIVEVTANKVVVIINSAEVKDKKINLYKL